MPVIFKLWNRMWYKLSKHRFTNTCIHLEPSTKSGGKKRVSDLKHVEEMID